jgi:hypothetical protein
MLGNLEFQNRVRCFWLLTSHFNFVSKYTFRILDEKGNDGVVGEVSLESNPGMERSTSGRKGLMWEK